MGQWDAVVTEFQPMVRIYPYTLHNDPPYLPCTVEFYLQSVALTVPDGGSSTVYDAPTDAQLVAANEQSFLAIPDDPSATSTVRQGNFVQSAPPPSYVHVMRVLGAPDVVDIQYWLLYAVRGRSTVNVDGFGPFDLVGPSVDGPGGLQYTDGYQGPGEHQGDWKFIVVRYDTSQDLLLGVFYGQHDSGIWMWGADVPLYPTTRRPIVYSSRNTHSCFPTAGSSWQINAHQEFLGVQAGLWEVRADGGEVWDCAAAPLTIICDDTASTVLPLPKPPPPSGLKAWLQYPGSWSATQPQTVSPNTFAGMPEWVQGIEASVFQHFVPGSENGARSPYFQTFWYGGGGGLETPFVCAHLGSSDPGLWWTCINSTLDGWDRDIPFDATGGAQSDAGPALATVGNQLFCVHAGAGDADLWWSTFDFRTDTWSADQSFSADHDPVHPVLAFTSPALAVVDGTLYCAYVDSSYDLYWTRFEGSSWPEPTTFDQKSAHRSQGGPALATLGSTMYCMHSGASDNDIWWTTFDATTTTWDTDQHVSPDPHSPVQSVLAGTSPALAEFNGTLYCAFVNASNELCWTQLDGNAWTKPLPFDPQGAVAGPVHLSSAGPALAAFDSVLYCVHVGNSDSDLWWCTFDPASGTWSDDRSFDSSPQSNPGHQSKASPALAVAGTGQ